VLTDVLNASSGRNYATETKVKQFILPGKFAGGFKLGLMAKDLETAGSLAEETGVNAASLAVCREAWRHALELLGPDADTTEIHKTIGAS
jgi:3-hydroxyisobutyrate dehydrogenase